MTLSIGLSVDPQAPEWLELAREAERVGVDSVWVPGLWAYDAFTPLAAISSTGQGPDTHVRAAAWPPRFTGVAPGIVWEVAGSCGRLRSARR